MYSIADFMANEITHVFFATGSHVIYKGSQANNVGSV